MVDEYCISKGLSHFDIAPYERENGLASMDEGAVLYLKLKKYIRGPYYRNRICVSFNVGTEHIYESLLDNPFDYEQSKYRKRTAVTLTELCVGDFVDARFKFGEEIQNGEVSQINDHSISVDVQVDGERKRMIEPLFNLIYIRKRSL